MIPVQAIFLCNFSIGLPPPSQKYYIIFFYILKVICYFLSKFNI
ncbi:hypothetical protein Newbould305_0740 [Staphylococcus aureus subsp. aureus str. Newbould 305]|nr:hypothetical protein Newbould305_0740 [Staphylococcus aureus subsp. aureus str. Newbould 305]